MSSGLGSAVLAGTGPLRFTMRVAGPACLSAVFQSFLTGLSLDLLVLGFSTPSSPLSVCVISASQDIPARGERSHCFDKRDSRGLASASAVEGVVM